MAIATVSVSFSATDTAAATWTLTSNPPKLLGHGVVVTDGAGPVAIAIVSPTNTGCTVNATAPFTGTVNISVSD